MMSSRYWCEHRRNLGNGDLRQGAYFSCHHFKAVGLLVLSVLDECDDTQRGEIVNEIVASINVGTTRSWLWRGDFERMLQTLKAYAWCGPLGKSLEAKLPEEQEEES